MSTLERLTVRPSGGQEAEPRLEDEENGENGARDASWLDAQLSLSLQRWDEARSQRNAKERKQHADQLGIVQRKHQEGTQDYQIQRLKLENAALKLQEIDLGERLTPIGQQEMLYSRLGRVQQVGRTGGLASDNELQRYDNAEARLDNAWDRLHNEKHQTANVVYRFRQQEDPGLHKRHKKLQKFARIRGELEPRNIQLQGMVQKLQTRVVEIEGEENMENAEGFMSGSDEFKEGDSGCQHDQHAPPPRSLGSVLTKEQAIQGRRKLEKCVHSLEARAAEEVVERQRLLEKLQQSSDRPKGMKPIDDTKRVTAYCLELPIMVLIGTVLGVVLAIPVLPAIGVVESEELAGHPGVVVPVYFLLVIPIGLYLTHDVIDIRWRTVRSLQMFSCMFGCMSFFGLALLTTYACVQFSAGDMGEGMAAVVSCSVAIYGGYLLLRQRAVLHFFTETVQRAARLIRVHGVVREEFDLQDLHLSTTTLKECVDSLTVEQLDKYFPGGPCYDKLSSALLDDNFPGEGPRVTWLAYHPKVIDKLEFIARIGLFILMASTPPGYSFSGQLEPHPDSDFDRPVDPSSRKALWTLDLARLVFCSTSKKSGVDPSREYSPSDIEDLVNGAATGGVDGVVQLVKQLRRVPISEWAEALTEYPSGEVIGLSEDTVSWEVLLALCSLQTKTTRGDEMTLRARAAAIVNNFEDFGDVDDDDESEPSVPVTACPSSLREDDLLQLLQALTKQWPILVALLEPYRAAGVTDVQFDEQLQRSQDVDLMVMVALILGVVPQWELEFDSEPFLPLKNTTLLFRKREEHVVRVVRKYHDRGDTE